MLKFKNKKQFKTFNYNQYGFKLIKTEKRHQILHLSKIGEIPIRCHRNIKGNIKQITIKKESSEKWYALIIENKKEIKVQKQIKNKVGIDLGIINYIYDSKGNYFTSPICLENSLKKLRIERKKLSDKKQGSKNYIRQKIKVAKIYEKIVNQRKDFLHKISNYYTHNYDFIAIEKLSIKRMIKVSYNARNIYNASWFKFIKMLHYKSKKMGCIVINVSPYQTSQICSDCGEKVSKQIWHRNHICKCGLKINRDYNAAKMILKKALGQELSESTLVEMKAPPLLRQPPFMKQETPILSKE
jgi:putative transposase